MTLRLAISVEGQTEYEFCREVLRGHLAAFSIQVEPKIAVTKRNLRGPNAVGGAIGIDRFRNEVRRLLPSFDFVTTLYDFYGFKDREANELPDALCRRMSLSLDEPRHLIPYVQVYEFESLLFSAPSALARFLGEDALGVAMETAVIACGGAEQVNDGPQTAPSERLSALFHNHLNQRYDKTFHGPLLALEIGLPAIRAACPRFDGWLSRLERLGN